jgi:hypothetical protein
MPLLSLDPETVFGKGSFIRHIPFLELSTPEEYLASVAPPANNEVVNDIETAETMEGAEYVGDVQDTSELVGDSDGIAHEETPLLSAPQS